MDSTWLADVVPTTGTTDPQEERATVDTLRDPMEDDTLSASLDRLTPRLRKTLQPRRLETLLSGLTEAFHAGTEPTPPTIRAFTRRASPGELAVFDETPELLRPLRALLGSRGQARLLQTLDDARARRFGGDRPPDDTEDKTTEEEQAEALHQQLSLMVIETLRQTGSDAPDDETRWREKAERARALEVELDARLTDPVRATITVERPRVHVLIAPNDDEREELQEHTGGEGLEETSWLACDAYNGQEVAVWLGQWSSASITVKEQHSPDVYRDPARAIAEAQHIAQKGMPMAVIRREGWHLVVSLDDGSSYDFNQSSLGLDGTEVAGVSVEMSGSVPVVALITEDGIPMTKSDLKGRAELMVYDDPLAAHRAVGLYGSDDEIVERFHRIMRDLAISGLSEGLDFALQQQVRYEYGDEDISKLRQMAARFATVDAECNMERDLCAVWSEEVAEAEKVGLEARASRKILGKHAEKLRGWEIERAFLLAHAPVLSAFDDEQLRALASGTDDSEAVQMIAVRCGAIAANIRETIAGVMDGTVDLWTATPLIEATLAELDLDGDTRTAVLDRAAEAGEWGAGDAMMLAFYLSLTVASIFTSGWALAFLGGVSLAASGAAATSMTQEYFTQAAATDSALDPRDSFLPPELSPSVWPLVMAWTLTLVDMGEAIRVLRMVKAGTPGGAVLKASKGRLTREQILSAQAELSGRASDDILLKVDLKTYLSAGDEAIEALAEQGLSASQIDQLTRTLGGHNVQKVARLKGDALWHRLDEIDALKTRTSPLHDYKARPEGPEPGPDKLLSSTALDSSLEALEQGSKSIQEVEEAVLDHVVSRVRGGLQKLGRDDVLSPDVVTGMCGSGSEITHAILRDILPDATICFHQAGKLLNSSKAQHAFVTLTIGDRSILIDTTFRQFLKVGDHGADFIRGMPGSAQGLASRLCKDGWAYLDDNVAECYARMLTQGERGGDVASFMKGNTETIEWTIEEVLEEVPSWR